MEQTHSRQNIYLVISLVLVALVALGAYALFLQNEDMTYENNFFAMGSIVEQKLIGDSAKEVAVNVKTRIDDIESKISWRNENSVINRLNSSATSSDWKVDGEVFSLLDLCCDVAKKTDEKFSPMILPLSKLWDFDNEANEVPGQESISEALKLVNLDYLQLDYQDRSAYINTNGAGVDLGAVGKGFACEQAVENYKEYKLDSAIISVGGTIGFYSNDKRNYNIAIKDPFEAMNGNYDSLGTLSLNEGFVATSGLYEKYFVKDGKTYHHILDTKTGFPVENDLMSVVVVAKNGALADCLSTACFVLGKEKSLDLLEQYNSQAIFVCKDKTLYATEGILENFEPQKGYEIKLL